MSDLLSLVRGCTFDDFLFTPQYSVVERRDPATIDLTCHFSRRLTLKRPIVSANMDTVTRAEMATAVAEEGGIGIVDRGFRSGDINPQVREVQIVKRKQHGVISDPYTIAPAASLTDAAARMRATGVGTLVVVDEQRLVQGLLTTRDLRFADQGGTVASRMTPRDRLMTHVGEPDTAQAEATLRTHKIKKLPLLNADGTLRGLITAKDLIVQRQLPFATRDAQGRLRVGAAIGAKGDYLERAAELLRAQVDVIVIDIAHGHSGVMAHAIEEFRKRFGDVELVAGNIATADGARALQYSERHGRRQAVLRRHAESGCGRHPGRDGLRVSVWSGRLSGGAAGPGHGARPCGADGEHDPVPQLQDHRFAQPAVVHGGHPAGRWHRPRRDPPARRARRAGVLVSGLGVRRAGDQPPLAGRPAESSHVP